MLITITRDPYKDIPPDYTSDDHQSTRDVLIEQREGLTHAEAAATLLASWNARLEVRKATWDSERSDRESLFNSMTRDTVSGDRRDSSSSVTVPTRPHTPNPQTSGESFSPLLSPGKPAPDFIDYPPSRFALNKLRDHDFVEDAAKSEHTNADNGFTLAQVDDVVTLQPAAQYKPASRVVKDEDLSWEQLSLASTKLIKKAVIILALRRFAVKYVLETGCEDWSLVSDDYYLSPHGETITRGLSNLVQSSSQGTTFAEVLNLLIQTLSTDVSLSSETKKEVSNTILAASALSCSTFFEQFNQWRKENYSDAARVFDKFGRKLTKLTEYSLCEEVALFLQGFSSVKSQWISDSSLKISSILLDDMITSLKDFRSRVLGDRLSSNMTDEKIAEALKPFLALSKVDASRKSIDPVLHCELKIILALAEPSKPPSGSETVTNQKRQQHAIGCTKRSCIFCHFWIENFNEKRLSTQDWITAGTHQHAYPTVALCGTHDRSNLLDPTGSCDRHVEIKITAFLSQLVTKFFNGTIIPANDSDMESEDFASSTHSSLLSRTPIKSIPASPTPKFGSVWTTVTESFDRMDLKPELVQSIKACGYERPSAIQKRAIYPIQMGHHVIAQIRPATGRCLTFSVSAIQKVDPSLQATQAIILVPTRERALQMQSTFAPVADLMKVTGLACVAGKDVCKLKDIQVVFATPGRIFSLITQKALETKNIKVAFLDEADELLSIGFEDRILSLFQLLPSDMQKVIFSATTEVLDFSQKLMSDSDPVSIFVKKDDTMLYQEFYVVVEEKQKLKTLCDIHRLFSIPRAVVVCNTRRMARFLDKEMTDRGFTVSILHGGMGPKERDALLQTFGTGPGCILHGDTSDNRMFIINYDLPLTCEPYINRISSGACGVPIDFVTMRNVDLLRQIKNRFEAPFNELSLIR